jgi:3-hydroxyacyl-CoA dehydrogenase
MGPLALCDLIGLDTIQFVAQSLYAEFKEPLYAPPSAADADGRGGPRGPQVRPRVLRLPAAQ